MQNNASLANPHRVAQRRRGSEDRRRSALRAPKKRTSDRFVVLFLYATLAAFYASYVYDEHVAALLDTAKWVPLIILAIVLVGSAVQHSALMPKGVLPLLAIALVAVATVSTLMGPYLEIGFPVLISLAITLATALLLARRIQFFSDQDSFFDVIVNVGRAVVITSFVYALLGLSLGRSDRFSGWTDNPNSLGLMLAPTLIILTERVLERKQRWLYLDLPFLLMGFYVLLLTESRAAIGWVAISLISFWYARAGLRLLVGGAFLAAIGLVGSEETFKDLSFRASTMVGRSELPGHAILSGRNQLWAIGLEKFHENFLGFGIGSSQPILQSQAWRFDITQGVHFHSSFITALVETGVPGLVILLAILAVALVKGFRCSAPVNGMPSATRYRMVLPWVLLSGAVFHSTMESWLLSAGNANMLVIWVVIALLFTQHPIPRPQQRAMAFRPHA